MTTELDKLLAEASERIEKVAGAASDDFGHSVTACMEWQVSQLFAIEEDVSRLIAIVKAQEFFRERVAYCSQCDMCYRAAKELKADCERIAKGEK